MPSPRSSSWLFWMLGLAALVLLAIVFAPFAWYLYSCAQHDASGAITRSGGLARADSYLAWQNH